MFVDPELSVMRRARRPAAVGVLLAFLASGGFLSGCKGPPSTLYNACIEDWPDERPPFIEAPSIADVEPAILWRKRVTSAPPGDSLLLFGDKVAFASSSRFYAVDRETAEVEATITAGRESVTSAVYDEQGNAYFAGYSLYSVAPDGSYRWMVPLRGIDGAIIRARGRLVLGPEGGLFFGASDGQLYCFESADGSLRWRNALTGADQALPMVVGGIGNALLAFSPEGSWRPQLWNRRNGNAMATFTSPEGERYGALIGTRLGIVTQRMEDRGGSYPWMHISVLDQCAKERWHLPAERPQWPVLIGPGDRLFVVERDDYPDSPTSVSVYGPDGDRVAGPTEMAIPWAIGADGAIYAVACDSPGLEGPSRLYAYDPDLQERWMVPLGDACPMAGPVIDDQGRLFFTWSYERVTEVVAVQTQSPGLAPTSWPTRRADDRGTGWVR